jgi:hypothetical protein
MVVVAVGTVRTLPQLPEPQSEVPVAVELVVAQTRPSQTTVSMEPAVVAAAWVASATLSMRPSVLPLEPVVLER